MTINFSQLLGKSNKLVFSGDGGTSGRPLYNDIPFTVNGYNTRLGGPQSTYREFWRQFKNSSELLGVISVPITDIIGDRPNFVSPEGKPLGRNKLLKVLKFWRDNRMKDSVKGGLFDSFITGDAYWWKGSLTEEARFKAAKEICERFAINKKLNTKEFNKLIIKTSQDEDLKKPRAFDYVASSTMAIRHNRTDVLGYLQNIAGVERKFSVDEIIHHRYLNVDGKVNGFAPTQALASEIWLGWFIKQNMVSFFRNGGSPSKAFILPEELSNSSNHKFLVQTLQRYQLVENRNGNLVFTGKVDIEDLSKNPKDMEYKDLALYAASNIAFAYGIPITRIPYLIGTSATKGDSGGLSEAGYWNKISEFQDELEDLLNSQFFEPAFGANIKFIRKYKQDEVRESQTANMNADTITKYNTILHGDSKKLSADFISQFLNIPIDEMEELSEEEKQRLIPTNNVMGQNQLDNNSTEKEPDSRKKADTKRNTANDKANKGSNV